MEIRTYQPWVFACSAVVVLIVLPSAFAQPAPPPDYDFHFATVGAVGNTPYRDDNPDYMHQIVNGRGTVNYEYRISTLENTTGQWMEFLNTFGGADGSPNQFWRAWPTWWNAEPGPDRLFRLRGDVENPAMTPVFGVTWRMGAMYCNWLHNGKSNDPGALLTGAYDVSTWGLTPDGRSFTDASTHMPGALYWIPTFDEQLKAFQYDPDRYGPGQGGWWLARNRSDEPGIPGPPGIGTTSAGYQDSDNPGGEWNIPLGAYTDSTSPWGLFDTSGGTFEWNEEVFPGRTPFGEFRYDRGFMGSFAGETVSWTFQDMVWGWGSVNPRSGNGQAGIRIASAVPAPWTLGILAVCGASFAARRHRKALHVIHDRSRRPACGQPLRVERRGSKQVQRRRLLFRRVDLA